MVKKASDHRCKRDYGPGTLIVMGDSVCVLMSNSKYDDVADYSEGTVFNVVTLKQHDLYFFAHEVLIVVDPTQTG